MFETLEHVFAIKLVFLTFDNVVIYNIIITDAK